jgi:hypothetical protein
MNKELQLLGQYTRKVFRYWWVAVVEVVLVLTDFVERLRGTWLLPPFWAKIAIGLGVLVVAQYLAYRETRNRAETDLAQALEKVRALETNWFDEAQVRTVRAGLEGISNEARGLFVALLQHAPLDRGRFVDQSRTNQQDFDRYLDEAYGTGFLERYREGPAQYWRVREPYVEAMRKILFPPPR